MYLSKLTLDPSPGARQVLRDLASPYEMHRTILRAFPNHDEGGPGRVLFRVEPRTGSAEPHVVLVQSVKLPDWSRLADLPHYLLSAESKPFSVSVPPGRKLRFRLRANPTVKRGGKRHALVKHEDQVGWLLRKGEPGGFRPVDVAVRRAVRQTSWRADAEKKRRVTQVAVLFEGVLQVTDPQTFAETIAAGIGPAKAFGFGLLSVAPP